MKAVVYYSWSGKTAERAKAYANKEGAALCEVRDKKRPGTLRAYTAGCFAAMRMKRTPTEPLKIPFADCDEIILMAPVWASHPAPAILSAFDALPAGKGVRVILVSGSGSSSCEGKLRALVESKGCKLLSLQNVKG